MISFELASFSPFSEIGTVRNISILVILFEKILS